MFARFSLTLPFLRFQLDTLSAQQGSGPFLLYSFNRITADQSDIFDHEEAPVVLWEAVVILSADSVPSVRFFLSFRWF